jgi:hypothetical protein
MQDFVPAFNLSFVKRFIALTWKEMILASLFQVAIGIAFGVVGAAMLCVGIYFAMVPVYFSWVHLHKQLYRLFLSRGGEPIPASPKLRDDIAPAL